MLARTDPPHNTDNPENNDPTPVTHENNNDAAENPATCSTSTQIGCGLVLSTVSLGLAYVTYQAGKEVSQGHTCRTTRDGEESCSAVAAWIQVSFTGVLSAVAGIPVVYQIGRGMTGMARAACSFFSSRNEVEAPLLEVEAPAEPLPSRNAMAYT
ncbi:MAG: hypothetical protein ACD_60C00109G0003 [uncultured bacterium]|nr:MAG: hypothetical protein ACD_60C00109G0003 [uncultured bacterium]